MNIVWSPTFVSIIACFSAPLTPQKVWFELIQTLVLLPCPCSEPRTRTIMPSGWAKLETDPNLGSLAMPIVMTAFLILSYLILSLWILVDTFIIYVVTTLIPHVRSQVTRRSTLLRDQ